VPIYLNLLAELTLERRDKFWSESVISGKSKLNWDGSSEFVNRLPFCERSAVLEYFGNSKRLFKIALLVDIAIGLIVQGVQLCIYTATILSALKRVGYIRYIMLSLM
jgi:hypothetical protein